MPIVTFLPEATAVAVPAGESLLEAARLAGIPVETPCGGKGTCAKCLAAVTEGEADFRGTLDADTLKQGYILICQTYVRDSDLTVNAQCGRDIGIFHDCADDMSGVGPDLLPNQNEPDFIVKTTRLTVGPPGPGDGLSDLDRLKSAAIKAINAGDVGVPLRILRGLPEILRQSGGEVTLAYSAGPGSAPAAITDIFPGFITPPLLSAAIDVGTTTVAASLADGNGRTLGIKSGYNGQILCGLDVISRINYAKTDKRREELRTGALETVNGLIGALCGGCGADASRIYNVSIAANTVMTHMLLGIIPEHIRLYPYTPAAYKTPRYTAGEIGISAAPGAPVYFAPAVGSYVGGDILSGLLCTPLAADSDDLILFIDIGTNGEIVLGNNEFMLACACSAGPAFEGGGIRSGMRASPGAIERVKIDAETRAAELSVIGGGVPAGICGSGMISIVSELFARGLIDPRGKFTDKHEKCFVLAKAASGGRPVAVFEPDIQNLIRAKAAIFSACRTLLRSVGLRFGDISKVYVAGGFGRYLNLGDAAAIGLLPRFAENRVDFLGNASLTGARMALVSSEHRRKQAELAEKITYVDLSGEPSYMDEYTAALFLPHTDSNAVNAL